MNYFNEVPYDVFERMERNSAWKHIHLSKINKITSIIKDIYKNKNIRVLEIGCGTGYATIIFDEFHQECIDVISTDIALNELKLAKMYSQKHNRASTYILCDAHYLPFKPSSFDLIFCVGVLHHIDDYVYVLKEIQKISYHFCCVEPNQYNPMQLLYQHTKIASERGDKWAFTPKKLIQGLERSGFEVTDIQFMNYIFPFLNGFLLHINKKLEPYLVKNSLLKFFSGSIFIYGSRK